MSLSTVLPRRVESARNALITYIHDRHLETGARLPAYAQLRSEFGFGSQTIAAAVESLCELGVLEVRDKVGLFVANPDGGHLTGRTIAVAVRRLDGSAYAATLAGFIQKLLTARNCRCMTFYQTTDPADSPCPGLDEFPGMEQAVNERRCDGIITLCPLDKKAGSKLKSLHIPYCFIGDDNDNNSPLSVVIDVKSFIKDAADALQKAGCRNIVQLCASSGQSTQREMSSLPAFTGYSYDGGADIAGKILAMPAEQRPDGIVSDDDTIVSGLLAGLISRQLPTVSYLPQIATITHKELGERYPTDKLSVFQQEIETFATMAVELLLDVLRGIQPEKKQLVYRFTPVNL